jgi:hypothetical protein
VTTQLSSAEVDLGRAGGEGLSGAAVHVDSAIRLNVDPRTAIGEVVATILAAVNRAFSARNLSA